MQLQATYCHKDIVPVEELRSMLRHIESQLPSIMHMPISLNDTLNFYQYFKTHVLLADGQFLLLIDIPIHDRVQQLQIYEIFNLPVLQGNVSAQYKINNKYIAVPHDEMHTVMITVQYYPSSPHCTALQAHDWPE